MEMENNQWVAIAPVVARHFWGEPSRKAEREMRWGRKGSKKMDLATGYWMDFEEGRGGGVIDLVKIELSTDRRGAVEWLGERGYIDNRRNVGRFKSRSGVRVSKHGDQVNKQRAPQKLKDKGTQEYGNILWRESVSISDDAEHPFRKWASQRNLLHPFCTCPAGIRWTRYRGGVIVAGIFPIKAWGKDGIPKGEPVGVQLVAIDGQGNKRYVLGPNKDRDKCSYGPKSAGVFLMGDPTGKRVNIVEGIADALAVYSREQGAVLVSLGSMTGLSNKPDVIDWLTKKQTWIFPDSDNAGDRGSDTVIDCIKSKSPDAVVVKMNARTFDDPGDWAERNPFAEIERYEFDEKSGKIFDSGLAWGEADQLAIQILTGGKSNE